MKKILTLGMILILAGAAWAGQEAAVENGTDQPPGVLSESVIDGQKDTTKISAETGTALLDLFLDNLRDMAQQGTKESLEKRLQEMMLAAKKAREANAIDAVFFRRFNRMLAVTKLVAVPDPTGILVPVIEEFLDDFVRDTLGHGGFREEGAKGPKAVNYVAMALRAELIDLQIYLDTSKERQALESKIDKKMSRASEK